MAGTRLQLRLRGDGACTATSRWATPGSSRPSWGGPVSCS